MALASVGTQDSGGVSTQQGTSSQSGSGSSSSTPSFLPQQISLYNQQYANHAAAYDTFQQGYANVMNNLQGTLNNVNAGYSGLGQTVQEGGANALGWLAQGGANTLQGYNTLSNEQQGLLQGTEYASELQNAATYAQANAQAQTQAINAGLGNSSYLTNLERGPQSDFARAQAATLAAFGGQQANILGTTGLAGLGYQGQLNQQQAAQINLNTQNQQQIGLAGLSAAQGGALGAAGVAAGGYNAGLGANPIPGIPSPVATMVSSNQSGGGSQQTGRSVQGSQGNQASYQPTPQGYNSGGGGGYSSGGGGFSQSVPGSFDDYSTTGSGYDYTGGAGTYDPSADYSIPDPSTDYAYA